MNTKGKRASDLVGRTTNAGSELHSIRLPKEMVDELKEYAEQEFRPFNGQIMYFLRQALRHERLVRAAREREKQTVSV